MTRVVERCGLACAILLICAPSAAAVPSRTGSWLAAQLQSGHRVVLNGVTVDGAVNLNNVDNVKATFECHGCVFTGRISAHDVVFERLVDLAGSDFRDTVDFTGARFAGPALFRAALADDVGSNQPDCRFHRGAIFAFAAFDDLASFGHTNFCSEVDFRDARFADATFSHSWFSEARFSRAAVRGVALFNDVAFARHAWFEEADFRVRADFARTEFDNGADFGAARFGGGASFLATTFSVQSGEEQMKQQEQRAKQGRRRDPIVDQAALFQDAVSAGDFNLTFATFERQIANFSDFVCGGTLIFDGVTFALGASLTLDRLQSRELVLDVEAADQIGDKGERLTVLRLIEDSAKRRGDVGTANDAHYRRRVLMSENYNAFWRTLDLAFYRGVAGYFVRPLRPLLVLLAVAGLFAFFRMRRPRSSETGAGKRRPRFSRHVWADAGRRCATFVSCLLDSLARAGPGWKGKQQPGLHERLEVLGYRLLLVCAVIGLANSNPTLRDMLDSLL